MTYQSVRSYVGTAMAIAMESLELWIIMRTLNTLMSLVMKVLLVLLPRTIGRLRNMSLIEFPHVHLQFYHCTTETLYVILHLIQVQLLM